MSDFAETKNIKYSIYDIRYTSRIDFPDEELARLWNEFNWEKAEQKLFLWQQILSKVALKKNKEKIIKLQNRIVSSLEARALAVKKVSDKPRVGVGIDGVRWRRPEEKMRAAILLNKKPYKCQPLKQVVIQDKRGFKERRIGIPTLQDRAMQILHFFALEPVAEAFRR